MNEADEASEFKRLLINEAAAMIGSSMPFFQSLKHALAVLYDQPSQEILRQALLTELRHSHRKQSFILNKMVAIPHVPWEYVGGYVPGLHRPKFGWFRWDPRTAEDERASEMPRIMFLGIAEGATLKHLLAFATGMLRDEIFLQEFQFASSNELLRQAVADAFERNIAHAPAKRGNVTPPTDRTQALLQEYGLQHRTDVCIRSLFVSNVRGLHARSSIQVKDTTEKYDCDLAVISHSDQTAKANDIVGIMMLGVGYGSTLQLITAGPEAHQLADALSELFESKFQEGS